MTEHEKPPTARYLDLTKIPPDEKPYVVEIAVLYNALRDDVDLITGSTDEERQTMATVFKYIRCAAVWLHSRRFNVFFATATIYMASGVLERFGIKQETLGRFIEAIVKLAEKAAS